MKFEEVIVNEEIKMNQNLFEFRFEHAIEQLKIVLKFK